MTDDEIIDVVQNHPDKAVTAVEVADALGCTSQGALDRLNELEAAGRVVRKKVGGRAVVWWMPD